VKIHKKLSIVYAVFLACVILTATASGENELTPPKDTRLTEAYASYGKGLRDEARGDRDFIGRPGQAQRWYEHAEDYYLKGEFLYDQAAKNYGINTAHEVAVCEKMYRRVHIKTGKARKRARKRR
jgi:hypothetical protein